MSTATVFQNVSKGGSHLSLSPAPGERYAIKRFADLGQFGPNRGISSVQLSSDPHTESDLYLFSGNSDIQYGDFRRIVPSNNIRAEFPPKFPWQDFHGRFVRLTLPGGSPPLVIDDLSEYQLNHQTASIMLVNRSKDDVPEEVISGTTAITFFYDLILGNTSTIGLIPILEVLNPGVAIGKMGEPLFTWVAYPHRANFSDKSIYFVVSQQFLFHASGFGVNVWLILYLRFSVSANHRLVIEVADIDRYVWPTIFGAEMQQSFDRGKRDLLGKLKLAASIASSLIPSTCDDVYLLPGTQPTAKATESRIELDDALEDVTIVLVNPSTDWPELLKPQGRKPQGNKPQALTSTETRPASRKEHREVTSVYRTAHGVTTHLCGAPGSKWSPIRVADAVHEIKAEGVRYYTFADERVAFLEVEHARGGGAYLRTERDSVPGNNLDNLPLAPGVPPPGPNPQKGKRKMK